MSKFDHHLRLCAHASCLFVFIVKTNDQHKQNGRKIKDGNSLVVGKGGIFEISKKFRDRKQSPSSHSALLTRRLGVPICLQDCSMWLGMCEKLFSASS